MLLPEEKELRQFDRWGVERPSHDEHGTLLEELVPFKATKWWVEGNTLFAEGNHGVIANRIPNDYICTGMDDTGLPILEKIDIKESSAADRGAK